MKIINTAIQQATTLEEPAQVASCAVLSQTPQEAAQLNSLSLDPVSGYDAAQIALRLFNGNLLEEFTGFMREKNLTPNIVLANGLTLLQNSLIEFPQDTERLTALLALGANPNLFMRKTAEKSFERSVYHAAYHPLNYAFANCPQLTTPSVCTLLRSYGANADGLRYHMEIDPDLAVRDDVARAKLRKELQIQLPDPECVKLVRKDVDLSIMQRDLADIQTQLITAGFQIVSYAPPVPQDEETHPAYEVAKFVPDKGIYMGVWQPVDTQGQSLNQSYHVFAAPTDLSYPSERRFNLVASAFELTSRPNWHGHKGSKYTDEESLYAAMKTGRYNGEWFVPTLNLLRGANVHFRTEVDFSLYDLRDRGDFVGTFCCNSPGLSRWYWSISTDPRRSITKAYNVSFFTGDVELNTINEAEINCRPIRAELIAPKP